MTEQSPTSTPATSDGVTLSSFSASDGRLSRSDAQLVRRALRERWPVTGEIREKILALIGKKVDDPLIDDRALASMARTVLDMDKVNLAREEFEDKRERLDNDQPTEQVTYRVSFANPNRTAQPLPEATPGDLDA